MINSFGLTSLKNIINKNIIHKSPHVINDEEHININNNNINTTNSIDNINYYNNKTKINKNININDITKIKNINFQQNLFCLEFPIFLLKSNKNNLNYQFVSSKNIKIEINGAPEFGRATIKDYDIIIYIVSKLLQLKYEGKDYTNKVQFTAYDYLKSTKKSINGGNYTQIKKSMDRLSTTIIQSNKFNDDTDKKLINNYKYIKSEKTGKSQAIEVELPEWILQELKNKKIIKIDPEYFNLTPTKKRLYQLAKRHCGNDKMSNPFNFEYFHKKTGSTASPKNFKYTIQKIIENQVTQQLPEYILLYNPKTNKIKFINNNNTNNITKNQEKKENIESRELRIKIKNKKQENQNKINENIIKINNFINKNYYDKKYPIFKTQILSDKKLLEYLRIFEVGYIIDKIRTNIDLDFLEFKNPEGYFYSILENGNKNQKHNNISV